MKKFFLYACLASAALGGCMPEFESQSLVDKFRILAVKAQPSAGLPGQEVTLTPLVSESRFGRQTILVWMTCIPLPGQTGKQCLEEGNATEVGFEETLTITLPELAEDEDEKSIEVILLACAGVPQMPDFEKGDYNFCSSPESDIAIRTVTVTREDPNNNPTIDSLSFTSPQIGTIEPQEGVQTVLDCSGECEDISLTLTLTPDSRETYEELRLGQMERFHENLFISWFATAGSYSDSRSFETQYSGPDETREELTYDVEWTPPEEGGEVIFYFVVYDGREGVDFWTREALVLTEGT